MIPFTQLLKVNEPEHLLNVGWTSDGSALIVHTADPVTSKLLQLTKFEEPITRLLYQIPFLKMAVSPTKPLVAVIRKHAFQLLDIERIPHVLEDIKMERPLSLDPTNHVCEWSPDGTKIAVVRRFDDDHAIFRYTNSLQIIDLVEGTNTYVTDPREFKRVNWSAKGLFLAIEGIEPNDVLILDGTLAFFTRQPDADHFTFGPLSSQVAWWDTEVKNESWLMVRPGSRAEDALSIASVSPVNGHPQAMSWSPDGKWLLFTIFNSNRTDYYLLNLRSLIISPLEALSRALPFKVVWSPDSQRLVIIDSEQLLLAIIHLEVLIMASSQMLTQRA